LIYNKSTIDKNKKKRYNIRKIKMKMIDREDKNKYFQIHINEQEKKEDLTYEKKEVEKEKEEMPVKKNVSNIFKDAGRQIIASFIILVIGFFALNYSAYYQIAKSKIAQLKGEEVSSPLDEMVQSDATGNVSGKLETSSNPEVQKRQIPDLNLEIAPSDNRIIIPRIDQNIPIVRISSESLIRRDWNALEKEMQSALKDGVVHYPGTSLPGQSGNIVITGHSSYFPWDSGRFKDVFALLHEVVEGDRIVVYYEQDKYIYEVKDIKIVLPEDIEVLKQTPEDMLTLITCTPVGTNLKRLIVSAKPIEINGKAVEGEKVLR
jgi:LPXTG-site transpeptidase (sortase) family protein